jgi:hypothetical protein
MLAGRQRQSFGIRQIQGPLFQCPAFVLSVYRGLHALIPDGAARVPCNHGQDKQQSQQEA